MKFGPTTTIRSMPKWFGHGQSQDEASDGVMEQRRPYHILHRRWRIRKRLWLLQLAIFPGTLALLVLFALAQPNTYRSKFWQIGYDHHWNSNPNIILYAYANHRPLPKIPFVWTKTLTNFNVAISIISLFLMLVNMIGTIMKVWYPLVGVIVNSIMSILYIVSVYGQMGPDHADSRYPSNIAWYISKSCEAARPYGYLTDCYQAKAAFAMTVYLLFLYLCYLGASIHSMLPNALDQEPDEDEEEEPKYYRPMPMEMTPRTPRYAPFTPRTQAFNTLDRKLPLREE